MNFISIGIHCVVADAIKMANKRIHSFPFDYMWCPAKTTLNILEYLINKTSDDALNYMITGYSYYTYEKPEYFKSVNYPTKDKMNKTTGLGIVHYDIDDNFKNTFLRRLNRLLTCIKSNSKIILIFSDATNKELNYHLDDIEYGIDATESLEKIYDLLSPLNSNIEILYFCWLEREKKSEKIKHIPFVSYKENEPNGIREIIKNYILKNYNI